MLRAQMHKNYNKHLRYANADLHGNISLEGDSTFGPDPDAPAAPPAAPDRLVVMADAPKVTQNVEL